VCGWVANPMAINETLEEGYKTKIQIPVLGGSLLL
jgi:hypothetical protein